MTDFTIIAAPVQGAIGSDYLQSRDQLIFVEFSGYLSAVNTVRTNPTYVELGKNYLEPEDVVLTSDGAFAYITERAGNLLKVDLSLPNADREQANLIAFGMNAPHQIALDEEHGYAYVVEFANPGRLLRIELATGTQDALVSNLHNAIGLLMTRDFRTAYVTEQLDDGTSQLSCIDVNTNSRTLLGSETSPLFFMTWAGDGESAILVPQWYPTSEVWRIDLTAVPVAFSRMTDSPPPDRPSSVAFVSPTLLAVCCQDEVVDFDPIGDAFSAASPLLVGIGSIPKTQIVGGLANTDPSYIFSVQDAVFGGTLPVMVNHESAFREGAQYYRVLVDGIPQVSSLSDYRWDAYSRSFVLVTVNPFSIGANFGFYPVRNPGDVWYNHWLGCMVDTIGLTNALHTIKVESWNWGGARQIPPDPDRPDDYGVDIIVDNRTPVVAIDEIYQNENPVPPCAIVYVDTPADATIVYDKFTFDIIAQHPGGYLKGWSLYAQWGENQSANVAHDSYENHLPGPTWTGYTTDTQVPVPSWHVSYPDCAHTFSLSAWDRVINGNIYLHAVTHYMSITITRYHH